MEKIPSKITLGGQEVEIRNVERCDGNAVGECHLLEGYWDTDLELDLQDWLWFINWCYKNHFDVNNLIEKGLAIDATGLNIY